MLIIGKFVSNLGKLFYVFIIFNFWVGNKIIIGIVREFNLVVFVLIVVR